MEPDERAALAEASRSPAGWAAGPSGSGHCAQLDARTGSATSQCDTPPGLEDKTPSTGDLVSTGVGNSNSGTESPNCDGAKSSTDEDSGAQEAKDGSQADSQPPSTTLMIRNIPNAYTMEMLLKEWPNEGTFDLLYLPRNFGGKCNLGYSFMNFTSEEHAIAFRDTWHKRRLAEFATGKRLSISFADVQGFEANVEQLKRKRAHCVKLRLCKPAIFKDGRQITLDAV